jgi:ABC-type multidrug transport system fused ATPase/permease subunit
LAYDWRGTWRLVRRFAPFARPYRAALIVAAVLILLRVATDLVQPWPLKIVIDHVLRDRPMHWPHFQRLTHWLGHLGRLNLLALCVAFLVGRAVADGLLTYLSSSRTAAIGQRVIFDVRRWLFDHVQGLSLRFFDSQRTGDLVTRFTGDCANVEDMLVSVVSVSLVNGLTVAATVALMAALNWKLTAVALCVLPALFLLTRHFNARVRGAARERRRKEGEIASMLQENLSAARLVQAFTRERHESARFAHHAAGARDAGIHSTELQARFAPLSGTITALGTTLVMYMGARAVLDGAMTLGTLIVMMAYLRSLYSPVKQLARLVNVVSKAAVSGERVAELLDVAPDVVDLPGAIEAPPFRGRVTFESISFAYRGPDFPPVLRDVSLDVPAGATVAVVGPTGAGKTTLVSLISRFADPLSGVVRIDGHDLRTLRLAGLRRQISTVPQESVLFRATVWENIAFGLDASSAADPQPAGPCQGGGSPCPDDVMHRIIAAARAANADEFIRRLPDGYETVLGERGTTLSGGQRQRVAIARAFVRNAPILILDEPTTGLDAEAERLVLEALDRLKAHRTTFIIAHRLSTVRSADLIVFLESGQITQLGTHGQLYRAAGRYRHFCDLQWVSPSHAQTSAHPVVSGL